MDSDLIVVVDDSPTVREIVKMTLTRAGYEVQGFSDGPSAIKWLQSSQAVPALFLVDLRLPLMGGYTCIRYFRAQSVFHNIPIVIMSRCHGFIGQLKGKAVGASAHLAKPFKTEELVSVIAKHLEVPAVV